MTDGPILAIDTSGATASVAVYADQVLAETTWHSGRRHSAELLPAIDDTLSRARADKKSLSAIAVAAGPGSYSGLRVGVSTAMSMALALDLPLAQVPTLDTIAWAQAAHPPPLRVPRESGARSPHSGQPFPSRGEGVLRAPQRSLSSYNGAAGQSIRAAIDVGRGRFATVRFRSADNLARETRIESVGLSQLVELAEVEGSRLAVDLDPETRATIEHEYGGRVELASPAACARRAGFLAELAAIKIRRGELVGDLAVELIYLS